MQAYFIAVFDSTHHALRFEKVLKENNIKLQIIPVPREITANCGLSVVFSEEDNQAVRTLKDEKGLSVKSFYRVTGENNKKYYELSL